MKNIRAIKSTGAVILIICALTVVPCLAGIPLSPTPTPTCPPCIPIVVSYHYAADDTAGNCYDGDGRMDAGEEIDWTVEFFNGYESSCEAEDCYSDIIVDNPEIKIIPDHVELGYIALYQSKIFIFRVSVGDVECAEKVTFTFQNSSLYCGSWMRDTSEITWDLEIDVSGSDWTCDDKPCGSQPSSEAGMQLILEDTGLVPGDDFHLHYYIYNASDQPFCGDIWILLDVYGRYWFYPGWVSSSDGIDFLPGLEIGPQSSHHETVLDFMWPVVSGSATGLYFYGALFKAGSFDPAGEIRSIEWGFSDHP
ncbi:hypothetical protein JXA40_12205 [bacterium]|nr:hypothetical protein [candidate division CSSED10-310 bacterium]